MKYLVKPVKIKEYGFCNNSGCSKNACINYSNSGCPGKTDTTIKVKV